MRLHRIAYVVESVLSPRDYTRFGLGEMVSNGIEVSVIDVTSISQLRIPQDRKHYDAVHDIDLHIAPTASDLAGLTPILKQADLIASIVGSGGPTTRNLPVLRWISRSGTPYMVFANAAFPGFNRFIGEKGKGHMRALDILKRLAKKQISPVNSALARLPMSWLGVRSPDYAVFGGRQSRRANRMVTGRSHAIFAHSFDYQFFQNLRETIGDVEDTAVFIDEFLPWHRDLAMRGQAAPMEAEAYFAWLRGLFDRIERTHGLEVMIAACPRADYGDDCQLFGDRRIIFNATARCIGESRLVIAHRSTAIGYAVMFAKPVLLVAPTEVYNHINHRIPIDAFGQSLGTDVQVANSPDEIDLESPFYFNEDAYDRYMEDYVKVPESPDLPMWQIIGRHLSAHTGDASKEKSS